MGKDNYYQSGGYVTFSKTLNALAEKGNISFFSAKKKNGLNPPLPLRIKKIPPNNVGQHVGQLQNLYNTIDQKIALSYYQQHSNCTGYSAIGES